MLYILPHSKRFMIETNTRVKVKVVRFVFGWRTGKRKLDCSFCTLAHVVTACIINSDKHSCVTFYILCANDPMPRGVVWASVVLQR